MKDALAIYSARGNVYAILTPEVAREFCPLPTSAEACANYLTSEGPAFARRIVGITETITKAQRKSRHAIDGIVVGPFQEEPPFEALIVNTDGSLAERSGNGLTNFSRWLSDKKRVGADSAFQLIVCAGSSGSTTTTVHADSVNGKSGFWLDMGRIQFGLKAVGGMPERVIAKDNNTFLVPQLARLDKDWRRTVFVNVGNPHAVTLLDPSDRLPPNRILRSKRLSAKLRDISFERAVEASQSLPPTFARGVNLQWAKLVKSAEIHARIFERGEGPTDSSGTSATAIAAAAYHAGFTKEKRLEVVTPGGTAFVELASDEDGLLASFFGTSEQVI